MATANELSDGQLLQRFITRRDETAFTALVQRHGPMVLAVCRRVLISNCLPPMRLRITYVATAVFPVPTMRM